MKIVINYLIFTCLLISSCSLFIFVLIAIIEVFNYNKNENEKYLIMYGCISIFFFIIAFIIRLVSSKN